MVIFPIVDFERFILACVRIIFTLPFLDQFSNRNAWSKDLPAMNVAFVAA